MKRIADTSRLEPTRGTREAQVLDGLQRYRWAKGLDPTAYELLYFLQVEQPTLDLNAVRPRLTALHDAGLVETTGKRRCSVTDKRVYTWATIAPRPLAVVAAHNGLVVQESLF